MILLVAGSRTFTDKKQVESFMDDARSFFCLNGASRNSTLVHGDCRGFDKLAASYGGHCFAKVKAFPADWNTHGKAAGPIRNKTMVDWAILTVTQRYQNYTEHIGLAALWNGISKGTIDMVSKCHAVGFPVFVRTEHVK